MAKQTEGSPPGSKKPRKESLSKVRESDTQSNAICGVRISYEDMELIGDLDEDMLGGKVGEERFILVDLRSHWICTPIFIVVLCPTQVSLG